MNIKNIITKMASSFASIRLKVIFTLFIFLTFSTHATPESINETVSQTNPD